ncbi:AbrB/MazE/SpoVT family DNA-binding domain-containing protein [Endothiovibrio diazotrophicus]
MPQTTVSSKYQVVIPQEVREQLDIRPGTRFQVIPLGNRIELIPTRDIREMRGAFKGIDTDVPRERDDRV